jgi:hypothetical protein
VRGRVGEGGATEREGVWDISSPKFINSEFMLSETEERGTSPAPPLLDLKNMGE